MSLDIFKGKLASELYQRTVLHIESSGIHKMLRRGTLVGLSGGADSVFLVYFLKKYLEEYGTRIVAVHINHLLRGDESMRDEEFSRTLCDDLGIEFISRRIDVSSLAKQSSKSIEECARDVRYNEFSEIIQGRNDIETIAVAHNSTDNAETVILNMLRGAGTRGCSGIPPVRDNICRPLLPLSKAEIVRVLEESGVPYVVDSTNNSIEYSRNFVRHEILPRLTRLSADPEKMIGRLSSNLRSDDDFILSCARDVLKDGAPTVAKLSSLHEAVFVRVLALMIGDTSGLTSSCISDIRSNLSSENFSYSLPRGKRFVSERGVCSVISSDKCEIDYEAFFENGKADIKSLCSFGLIGEVAFDNSSLNIYKKSIQANLRSAIINGRLYFRPKKDGDTIYYGGMTHKIKKLYNDRKIPKSLRDRIPLLCDESGVLWVPGFGVRDDGGVGEGPFVAICSYEPDQENAFLSGSDFK